MTRVFDNFVVLLAYSVVAAVVICSWLVNVI